jgi:hypothetical protein
MANAAANDGTTSGLDAVRARAGVLPEFWGRYIGGQFALAIAEVNFLNAAGCKILVIYNNTSSDGVQGAFIDGQNAAQLATNAATNLGAPPGLAIYADIEGYWIPTADWLRGWATGIVAGGFSPGFYCDTTPGGTFSLAYCKAALIEPTVASSYLWSMQPQVSPGSFAGNLAPAFSPNNFGCGSNPVIWQYTENCYEDVLGTNQGIDMDLATDSAFSKMW